MFSFCVFTFANSVLTCKYCKLSYCYCVYDAAGMERTVPHHQYISKETGLLLIFHIVSHCSHFNVIISMTDTLSHCPSVM